MLFCSAVSAAADPIASPSQFLGFEVGADRKLADYAQISAYFRMLDGASERVALVSLGKTTLGNDMLMAVISSEENIRNLPRLREIARRLADPRGLDDAALADLVSEGRTVVLVTCNIHSSEIASSQMAMEWAHALATAVDEETKRRLANVVLLLVPSLNPDGETMETEWYRKNLGTKFEGVRMPWLYHHYVGHDNNRDWFMLTQKETRALTRAVYHQWFPQVFVDEHQMGMNGPRMFIPPFADPVDPDVDPLIWREINLIGSTMALRLEQERKAGVIYGYSFDAYWLGGTRNTGWWKNVTGLLLETASARLASPIELDPSELRGGAKGLSEYQAQVNHPNPWKGGVWRMRDIMDYERIASDALHEVAADRREDFLWNIARRAQASIALAKPREAFLIPRSQRDQASARRLALLMADHGVEVVRADTGDYWIPLAQPFGRFVREILEPQRYPEVRPTAEGDILRPYDVATWTLPLMMGVTVEKTTMPALLDGARVVPPILAGDIL
ncbi:MAG TPA: M14 metallopeptidase family protein, partial [Thermoanaerobaculia bacterium]|nr:M14 metallopeptidase family protein [Thermoanaerobaculia bacterium]